MTDELVAAHPDVVVVDALTGNYDVIRLCRDVHDSSRARIVVVVPAERMVEDALVIDLLDARALDVVRAGVSTKRLLAHVRAALRTSPPQRTQPILTVGDVVIDWTLMCCQSAARSCCCPPAAVLTPRRGRRAGDRRYPPGTCRRQPVAPRARDRPRRPRLETVSQIGYRLAVD